MADVIARPHIEPGTDGRFLPTQSVTALNAFHPRRDHHPQEAPITLGRSGRERRACVGDALIHITPQRAAVYLPSVRRPSRSELSI